MSLTTDEAAFINAIRERPADDAVRLVFADWLDEHGRFGEAAHYRIRVSIKRQTGASNAGRPFLYLPRALPVAEPAPEGM